MPGTDQLTDRYHEIRLYDTASLTEDNRPRGIMAIGLVLNRPSLEIHNSRTPNEDLARAVIRILEPSERDALLEDAPRLQYDRCCIHCGSSLSLKACNGCGRTFRDDQFETTRGIDLPPQVRAWLQVRGHVFER